jgi:hypothetical protein
MICWSGTEWVLARATHGLEVRHISGSHCCRHSQRDSGEEAIYESRFSLPRPPGFPSEAGGFRVVGWIGSERRQLRNSISVELCAPLPQRCIRNRLHSEQKFATHDIRSRDTVRVRQPTYEVWMTSLPFDKNIGVNEPGHWLRPRSIARVPWLWHLRRQDQRHDPGRGLPRVCHRRNHNREPAGQPPAHV